MTSFFGGSGNYLCGNRFVGLSQGIFIRVRGIFVYGETICLERVWGGYLIWFKEWVVSHVM